jgi:cytochrome c oxidase subunit 1
MASQRSVGRAWFQFIGSFHVPLWLDRRRDRRTIGTEQINMLVHNTLRLPGHFHATVVSGTTLAFMGFTYYVIPLIFRKELKLKNWAVWQPYVFGTGMLLTSMGMIVSGLQGVARRNWDITFAGVVPGTVEISLAVFGIGAIIAVTAASCM